MHTITVDGSFNVRAFGELQTPWLFRSATLDGLTGTGEELLTSMGVGLVVDLREDSERAGVPHAIPVRNIPLYRLPTGPPLVGSLEEIYELLLRSRGSELTAAVAAIADAPGATLVHCTAGKDRTGLVIALTLLAVGVSGKEIIDDYARSENYVSDERRATVDAVLADLELDSVRLVEARRLHLDSPAEALEHAIAVLDELGGVHNYLHSHGLTAQQFNTLRERSAKTPKEWDA